MADEARGSRLATMRRWLLGVAGVLAVDQGTKAWVTQVLRPGEALPLWPGVLSLTRVHNPGAAFGLFPQGASAFLAVSAAVVAGLGAMLFMGRLKGLSAWGGTFVLAGALGNLLDRLRLGYVLDFLAFPHFPVFNVADSAIVLGAALLAVGIFWERR